MAPVGSVPAARPSTYIDSGTVASDISGASDAPTMEPVAKITAEFAPVSACAAASLTTLERARASPEVSSAAVTSIIPVLIQCSHERRFFDSRYYEMERALDQPMQTGWRYARWAMASSNAQTPASGCWPAYR